MAKPRTGGGICGFCATAPATRNPIVSHDKCAMRYGHECICADDDHEPTTRVLKAMATSLHSDTKTIKEMFYG